MQNEVTGYPDSVVTAKAQAKRLMTAMGGKDKITHSQALELVAKLHGANTWAEMSAGLSARRPEKSRAGLATGNDQDIVLFTEMDYIRTFESLGEGEMMMDIIGSLIHSGVREISPSGLISSLVIGEMERSILRKAEKRTNVFCPGENGNISLHQYLLSSRSAIRNVSEKMLSVAREKGREDRFRNAAEAASEDDLLLWGDNDNLRSFSVRTINSNIPEINRKHTLAVTDKPEFFVEEIKKSQRKVIDLFTREDLDDLGGTPFGETFKISNIPRGMRSVNPVSVLKLLVFERLGHFSRESDPTVIITSLRDMENSYGSDVLLAQARSMGGHFIIFADKDQVADHIFGNVDHVWKP